MVVTEIRPLNSKKSSVYIDEQFAFQLYCGEIRRYHLAQGEELAEETYEEIVWEVLFQRCKSRAMHLLVSMDRTQTQLKRKLSESGYPEEVIAETLEYVKRCHYVDDFRYAKEYIRIKGSHKSVRQMRAELQGKGVSSDVIAHALEMQEADESAAIRKCIEKKHIDWEHLTREKQQKLYQFLLRKGFSYEDVHRELKLYEISEN